MILSPLFFPPNPEKIGVKIIEKHIGRHENGNLYLVVRKNGILTKRSLKTTNLAEAQRKIREMGTVALTAARQPAVPALEAIELTVIDLKPPVAIDVTPTAPAISLAEALVLHDRGLVTESDGTREMAARCKNAIERFCEGWDNFEPVEICSKYRDSGKERKGKLKGKPLGSAVNHLRWYLRKFVPWAFSRGLLGQEAMDSVKKLKTKVVNPRRIRVPPASVVGEFLAMVASEDSEGAAFLQFLTVTGVRRSGGLNLEWSDIDFREETMAVMQKGGVKKVIPMTPEAIVALQGRSGSPRPWPLDVNAMNRLKKRMKRFARGFDIDLKTFHSFRHYFASYCLLAGVSVKEVAELLGHSDEGQLVLKTYGHLCKAHLKSAISKLRLAS